MKSKKIFNLTYDTNDVPKKLNVESAQWYQCDIITKKGDRDFWCRFIASNYKDAEARIAKLVHTGEKGLKGLYNKLAGRYFIKGFDINLIPNGILSKYNLNNTEDLESFYKCAKD